ncbi:MAG: efflux RND transporter periplasmic adaptor subunit [Verrucomicrobiota bacterium]
MTENLEKRSKRYRSIAAMAAVAAASLVLFLLMLPEGEEDGSATVPFFEVVEGPLTISVTESGTIKPREQVIIKSEIEGRNTILYLIPEGAEVQKGELLVELDASSLKDQKIDQEIRVQNAEASYVQSRENLAVVKNQATSNVEKARLDLRFAKEDLAQYKDGEYPNTLKEREAKITLTREELKRAEEELKWSMVLFEEKYIAESELQADALAVSKAELDLELAESSLTLLKEFTYKRQIDQLRSDIEQAEMAYERIKSKAAADVVQAEADLRAKELDFRRQKDKLAKIEEQISKAKIVAPRDGLVVYATSAEFRWRGNAEPLDEGQEVRERQELIHLPTASTFLTEVKVNESNLDKIEVGMPVRVTAGALPGKTFSGAVEKIAPLADPTSTFLNPDLKVYRTQVQIEGGGKLLRTGMSCEVEIIVQDLESAVYVPVQCVVRRGGNPVVYVKNGDELEERRIEIGLDNNRMVHVLDGLSPGENVSLVPPLKRSAAENRAGDTDKKTKPDGRGRQNAGQRGEERRKNPVNLQEPSEKSPSP